MLHKRTLVNKSDANAALAFKALGEPRRLEILRVLRSSPRAVGEIAAEVDVSQQAVSQHLAVLDRAGLVEAHKQGTRNVYRVRAEGFKPAQDFVRSFWDDKLLALKAEIEKNT